MPTKIRKRGDSSSASPSSRIQNFRLNKRAISVKNRVGLMMESGASTPVPAWRITPRRGAAMHSLKGSQPVSARRLAANLWEMNESPSSKMSLSNLELMMKHKNMKNGGTKMDLNWEKARRLLDPSHDRTVSEKMDRYRTSSHHRRTPSITHKLHSAHQNAEVVDSMSNASFMETENRSRPQTPTGSFNGSRNRLKDVSSALSNSKELLKIINRVWAQAGQPSSTMSLISALHSELERGRLQVNHLIQEQLSDKHELNYLMKCFSKERASWKNKEQQRLETLAGELEMENKLRRQLESLNMKLGLELAEIKSSFVKVVKELESEKRAREVTEQVCNELERNINEDRVEKKRESVKVYEEMEKERKRLESAETKHQHEEKITTISKVRKQLEVFLATKKDRDEGRTSYFSKTNIGSHQNEQKDDGEVEDDIESIEDSAESDLHSIELNLNGKNKYYDSNKWDYNSAFCLDSTNFPVNNEIKARKSISGQDSRRSTSLLRTMSGGLDKERLHEIELEAQTRSYFDEVQRYKSVNARKDGALLSSRVPPSGAYRSPSRHRDQSFPLRDHCGIVPERSSVVQETRMNARVTEGRGEGRSIRRSKW